MLSTPTDTLTGRSGLTGRSRLATPAPTVHSGVCRGTLGELFQGPYWESERPEISIVSLPVDKFSWCHFEEDPDGPFDSRSLAGRSKAARAVDLFTERYGLTMPGGRISFHSELTVGQGMASSTADIVATLRCLLRLFAIPYDQQTVIWILSRIERADSVFLEQFALYLSGRHRVVRPLGDGVGMHACWIAEEGSVDTEQMTEQLLAHYTRRRTDYELCADRLVDAFRRGDARGIASASTRSAELSQDVVPKATFDQVHRHRSSFKADGVLVAHTGTVIGYLFRDRPDQRAHADLSEFFQRMGRQCQFSRVGWGNV
ncbi:hypothetical protein [Streptomyces sp. NPDC002082]|uniref:GHMP family kinase ATP-binding protein n=1 Tax=Streptomyces sp. NPDC002082 TaxID=3154772 RepID=UPI00332B6771